MSQSRDTVPRTCTVCGAVVADEELHVAWHFRLTEVLAASQAPPPPPDDPERRRLVALRWRRSRQQAMRQA